MRLIRFFYNLLFPIVLLALLPGFLLRMLRRGNYRHKFGQRFGIYSKRVLDKLGEEKRWTWIHAVSVGEVMIALKFIKALKEREPDLHVVLSTTTSTGYRLAHRQKSSWLEPVYNPLDFLWSAARAVGTIRPKRLILVEAEVWPNITALAKQNGASLALINARLSSRSEGRYRKVKPLVAPLFNQLDAICVQEEEDINRWLSLGVRREKIKLTGSIKFDNESAASHAVRDFTPLLRDFGVPAEAKIILGGSTFEGEEILLAQIRDQLARAGHSVFLILVPRHAERGRQILADLERHSFQAALRSEAPTGQATNILIVNSTGELRDWYRCADVVFIGKTLATNAKGGQNPAEAIEVGKPVIFGPNMQNFKALVRQLVSHQAAIEVKAPEELQNHLERLLENPEEGRQMAAAGMSCLEVHRGATARTCDILQKL